VSVSGVRPEDGHPNYLQWYVNNTGDADVWVAPYSVFYQRTASPPGYIKSAEAVGYYRNDTGGNLVQYGGYGWADVLSNTSVTIYSEATVPIDVTRVVYNAWLYHNGTFKSCYPDSDKYVDADRQSETPKKYIIFRDDDVAPWNRLDTLKRINQIHMDKNIPVTLGVVPHPSLIKPENLFYTDSKFFEYMKSISSNPLFEFAQHGYTHHDYSGPPHQSEFYGHSYSDQYQMIKKGQLDFTNAFGVEPTTFIPPWNRGDDNTLKALKALGFTEYSSSPDDFNIDTGYKDGIWVDSCSITLDDTTLPSAKDITERLLNDNHTNTVIVFYHFWSFSGRGIGSGRGNPENAAKVQLFEDYLDYLKNRSDVIFTRLDRSYSVEGQNLANSTPTITPTANNTVPGAQEKFLNESSENKTIVELIKHQLYPVTLVESLGNKSPTEHIEYQLYPITLIESQDRSHIERI
jgi:peptidoglycan/xylan/chitin deacetylase (PgdA/CDA1 family)